MPAPEARPEGGVRTGIPETPVRLQVIRHRLQPYPQSVREQERIVAALLAGHMPPTLILTEHPPVYTIGTSGRETDILRREFDGERIEVHSSGRGGEVTYHGPGQLVCYVIADLRCERDLHRHVWRLEEMIIATLAAWGVTARRSHRGIGVWVGERKIAAIGVRCRKWITYHGVALNIDPNLEHFTGIIPCGMRDAPVTSLRALGLGVSRREVEEGLLPHAQRLFGASQAE